VYEPAFGGGVRLATADFTGDGWPDLAVGPGAGGGPRVRLLDGRRATRCPARWATSGPTSRRSPAGWGWRRPTWTGTPGRT
jgi:hypothetical protein